MKLDPRLQRSSESASAFDKRGISQAIIGPSPSGKTTQAIEYAEALKEKGVSGTIMLRDARKLDDNDAFAGVKLFEEADHAILVIEHLEDATPTAQGRIASGIAGAIERESTVVIVTGTDKLQDMLQQNHIASRFGTPVTLEKLTPEQIAHYHLSPEEQAEALRQQEAADKRLAEWKENKPLEMGTKQPITAPQTARFTRKPGGTPDA